MPNQIYLVNSPLRVPKSKNKDFILNLNQYRNTYFRTLNAVKIKYKELITPQLLQLPEFTEIHLGYVLFPKTRHKCDLDNVIAVHAKFFQDALVELNKIPEDNYEHITRVTYKFGAIDKNNPRVEIYIKEIK